MGWDGIKNHGFGSRPKEVDDEYRARAKGVQKKRIWTKDYCIDQLDSLLEVLKKILKDDEKINVDDRKKLKDETVRDAITLMNKIMDFMRYLYPPVQENVNVNIEANLNDIIEKWKKKKRFMVIEDAQE